MKKIDRFYYINEKLDQINNPIIVELGVADTAISTKNFTDNIKNRAIDMGRLIGTAYGEGFTVDRNIAVDSLFDLK